jgi:drug/metabolite transporter (DMT)-like permease
MENAIIESTQNQITSIGVRKNELKYILLVGAAVCFLATGGIFVKVSKLPPINTGFYRVLFSVPILFPFVFRGIKQIATKDLILMLIAGAFLAGDLTLWNISFHYTTVANGNLLANLVSFTIIPVSYFVFKEKIPKMFFIGLIITLLGIVILMLGKIRPSYDNFYGDVLAFLTSIFYALFILTVYKVRDRVNAMTIMFVSAFGSCIVLFVVALTKEGIYYPKSITELYPLVGLAIISQIMGQGLLSFCLGKVRASLSSVLVLAQPMVAAIYSYLIFSEKLSIMEIGGIIITLIGISFAKRSY